MNLADAGIYLTLISALGGSAKFYADNTYLLVADSLKGQLYQKQEQIFRLEQQRDLSEDDREFLNFLKLQEKRLQQELE